MTKTGINASRQEVRKFGLTFAALCAASVGVMLYKHNPHWPYGAAAALVFLAAGLFAYPLLRPVYIGWMKFAFVLGWINTRILLGIFFYLILAPGGLLLRLFGKDLLDERIDRSATTYWKKRDPLPFDRARYERLF